MKKRKYLAVVGIVLLIGVFLYTSNPRRSAERFVARYGEDLERRIEAGNAIPARIGYRYVNDWSGDGLSPMTEFILSIKGDTYYGCYYSSEDMPLAFQNVSDVDIVPNGSNRWSWTGEGDNHGTTVKLSERWYYFEASF